MILSCVLRPGSEGCVSGSHQIQFGLLQTSTAIRTGLVRGELTHLHTLNTHWVPHWSVSDPSASFETHLITSCNSDLILCLMFIQSEEWDVVTHWSFQHYLCNFDFFFSLHSLQDVEKLSDSLLKTVLTLSTVYYWFPKSQGRKMLPAWELISSDNILFLMTQLHQTKTNSLDYITSVISWVQVCHLKAESAS